MNIINILTAILTLMAGIGVFLIACNIMSTHLENAGSRSLKRLFAKTGKSKWIGVGIGTVGTAAIQSSGAVTVMVIGFVNVGIMSLAQAATIIYGANIGTTITAQIVALGMFGGNGISTTVIFAAFTGLGIFMAMFAKRERIKLCGNILAGFGLLFVGLHTMSDAMDDFAALDSVREFLSSIGNPLILVLTGTFLTAIIQSSSVLTSIVITMVFSGLISLNQGIYLTMGSNIGSCVVAIIAAIGSGTNAKRTAMLHLLFNVMGVSIFLAIGMILKLLPFARTDFGSIFGSIFPNAPQLQLAMFHTIFNVSTTLFAIPLTEWLISVVCLIVPENQKTKTSDSLHLYFLDETMLRTPIIAVKQMKAELENMAELAFKNFKRAINMVTSLNFDDLEPFKKTESELNFLNSEITRYVVALSGKPMSDFDNKFLNSSIKSASDLERIGDYAVNIVEYASQLKQQDSSFSVAAVSEIAELEALITALFAEIKTAFHDIDLNALDRANLIEDKIDAYTNQMENNHIGRLVAGKCTPQVGAEFISLAQNSERAADHLINFGKSIRKLAQET